MAAAKFKKSSENNITGEATINELPENILLQIMSYLTMKDRCRLRRVCQKWNQIMNYDSLWRHVDLLEFPIGLKTLWRLVRTRFSPRMSVLKLRGYDPLDGDHKRKKSLSDAVLKKIAACCPNLQVLHLKNCRTETIKFESLPTSIVCLEIVDCYLVPGWMADKQKHLPKLEHLNLDYSDCFDDVDMCYICDWSNLKYLSMINDFVGNEGVITIANNLCELEYLNICWTDIDDDAVYHITQHLKKLRQLCLAECCRVTDKGIVEIATGLPMLDRLDISHCCLVTMRGLETLFDGSIRELIAVGLTELSNKDKRALKRSFAVTRFR
ncbi:hypothetical protein BsWGS_19376 [Bradybaena similaris]